QPRQIVGGGREGEGPPDAIASSKLGLPLSGDRLDPAEGFFDPLANALADSVAGMARRAAVNRRRATARILRHMQRHFHRAQFVDEILRVIGLVGAQSDRLW